MIVSQLSEIMIRLGTLPQAIAALGIKQSVLVKSCFLKAVAHACCQNKI